LPRKVILWAIKFTKKAFSEVIMLLSIFAPYKLYIYGDDIIDESTIIISNHSSFLDWFYIWNFISYFEDGSILKTILKYDLKNIPIIGNGMEFFEFIFLKRKLTEDKDVLLQSLDQISKDNEKFWLLIFPEGTIISNETKKTSDAYANKNDLRKMENVLIPKTTGLNICSKKLLKDIGSIYDLTIAYKNISPGIRMDNGEIIKSIFFDKTSNLEVHICINRIPVEEIYKKVFDDDKFQEYIYELFYKKDKKLEFFNSKGYFSEDYDLLTSEYMLRKFRFKNLFIIWMFWIFIFINFVYFIKYN
jgi:1-acyl-sn-glycerol-3-phosphate acyltransferase